MKGRHVSDTGNSAYIHLQTTTISYYHVKGNKNEALETSDSEKRAGVPDTPSFQTVSNLLIN